MSFITSFSINCTSTEYYKSVSSVSDISSVLAIIVKNIVSNNTHSLISSLTLVFLSFKDRFFSCGFSTLRSLRFAYYLVCLVFLDVPGYGTFPRGQEETEQ